MSFEENIKKWTKLDNSIKELNEEIKILKKEKETCNEDILDYVNNNNLNNATILINDGKLRFTDSNYSQPLTYKFLIKCFQDFFKDNETTISLINFIKTNREIKTIKEIKRTYK